MTIEKKHSILSLVERHGRLAQLGEHLPYKQRVIGSSPIATTMFYGPVVQLVRTLACHARGRRFEPVPGRHFWKTNSAFQSLWGWDSPPRPMAREKICPDSSVGRAEDWKSSCQWFDSTSSHQTIISTKNWYFFSSI